MSRSERMSPVDTTWLRMDRPTSLMIIVGVWLLEGPIAINRLEAQLARRTSGSSPVSAAGRVPTGRRLLVRRPELRHCASHQARAAAGTRRQAGARTLCGRSRLRAARSRPSALDDPYRRGVRGRRGAGVPHASCDWRRSRPGRRHDVPRRWSQAQDASRRARARRRRLAAESDGARRGGDQPRNPGLEPRPCTPRSISRAIRCARRTTCATARAWLASSAICSS